MRSAVRRKIIELEEELKIVGNNMKSLEIAEQEVRTLQMFLKTRWSVKFKKLDLANILVVSEDYVVKSCVLNVLQ